MGLNELPRSLQLSAFTAEDYGLFQPNSYHHRNAIEMYEMQVTAINKY